MIKLTNCWYDGGEIKVGRPLWVATAAIQIIELFEISEGVFLTQVSLQNHVQVVLETPEQIMAMPEMLYAMYPAMIVNQPDPFKGRG